MIEDGGTYERCKSNKHEISAIEAHERLEHFVYADGPDGVRMAVKYRVIHTF